MKTALSAAKAASGGYKADLKAFHSSTDDAFRVGIQSRRKALDLLATIQPPRAPARVGVDTPILIWAVRDYGLPTDMLLDSHVEPLNNWAKIYYEHAISESDLEERELGFYFLWENNFGEDVVVNVSTFLMVRGGVSVFSDPGWFWTPFWAMTTIGNINTRVDATLTLFEWWNDPPTQPLQRADQVRNVAHVTASGGWTLVSAGDTEVVSLSDYYSLDYDMFLIPRDGVAVFEVALKIYVDAYDSTIVCDFSDGDALILCPGLELEVMAGPGEHSAARAGQSLR